MKKVFCGETGSRIDLGERGKVKEMITLIRMQNCPYLSHHSGNFGMTRKLN